MRLSQSRLIYSLKNCLSYWRCHFLQSKILQVLHRWLQDKILYALMYSIGFAIAVEAVYSRNKLNFYVFIRTSLSFTLQSRAKNASIAAGDKSTHFSLIHLVSWSTFWDFISCKRYRIQLRVSLSQRGTLFFCQQALSIFQIIEICENSAWFYLQAQ